MAKPYLSVVIPAYNEVKNYERGVLDEVAEYLNKQKYSWECLLVNDGSTDGTLNKLKEFAKKHKGFRVVDIEHGGKAAAVTAGIMVAKGEIVLFTDFDQSTPLYEVEKFLVDFEKGADVVIANRVAVGAERQKDPLLVKLRSRMFNLFVQVVILPGISDTQCGFKALRGEVAKKLFKMMRVHKETEVKGGYMGSFDTEVLFLAKKLGYKLVEVPVKWQHFESGRLSASEPVQMVKDILKVRWYWMLGKYE
jgi:glycosyltransferase involved in cell wall biosynthesis